MSEAVPEAESTSKKQPLVVIVGPTASGKSALAARLASRVGGEVISADSVQVYRYFDIGSGKPSAHELGLAPHHLIDCARPDEPLEASVWADRAHAVIAEIVARGHVPIVCGGTFLWVRALLFGLADAPGADPGVRERHKQWAEREGRAALHRRLGEVDPKSAARLHENDFVRVSRALEVFELSGRRLSDIQQEHGFRRPRYDATLARVDFPQQEYEERLVARVDAMLRAGFKDEVRELIRRGFGGVRAMEAVGYKQVHQALTTEPPPSDEDLRAEIVRVTRIFARRQRTWLRDESIVSIEPLALRDDEALARVASQLGLPDSRK